MQAVQAEAGGRRGRRSPGPVLAAIACRRYDSAMRALVTGSACLAVVAFGCAASPGASGDSALSDASTTDAVDFDADQRGTDLELVELAWDTTCERIVGRSNGPAPR